MDGAELSGCLSLPGCTSSRENSKVKLNTPAISVLSTTGLFNWRARKSASRSMVTRVAVYLPLFELEEDPPSLLSTGLTLIPPFDGTSAYADITLDSR